MKSIRKDALEDNGVIEVDMQIHQDKGLGKKQKFLPSSGLIYKSQNK